MFRWNEEEGHVSMQLHSKINVRKTTTAPVKYGKALLRQPEPPVEPRFTFRPLEVPHFLSQPQRPTVNETPVAASTSLASSQPKKKRGRPRKIPISNEERAPVPVKRRPGRPRKSELGISPAV